MSVCFTEQIEAIHAASDADVFKRNSWNETWILLLFFSSFKTLNFENFLYQ